MASNSVKKICRPTIHFSNTTANCGQNKCFSSWGTSYPDALPGLCPWIPLADFHPIDPQRSTLSKNLSSPALFTLVCVCAELYSFTWSLAVVSEAICQRRSQFCYGILRTAEFTGIWLDDTMHRRWRHPHTLLSIYRMQRKLTRHAFIGGNQSQTIRTEQTGQLIRWVKLLNIQDDAENYSLKWAQKRKASGL